MDRYLSESPVQGLITALGGLIMAGFGLVFIVRVGEIVGRSGGRSRAMVEAPLYFVTRKRSMPYGAMRDQRLVCPLA